MMNSVLYGVWFLIPTFFLVLALWGKLEQLSGQAKRDDIGDYVRQGVFVLVCALVSVFIDKYMLESFHAFLQSFLVLDFSIWLLKVLLLPVVLYVAAFVAGPSKQIRITKAPTPSKSRPKKGRR